MVLCDVNVLIYAHREDAADHAFYRAWLEDVLAAQPSFLYCEFVLSAVIRIATHPKIFRSPSALAAALQFVDQVRSAPNAIGIMPGSNHWKIFRDLCTKSRATGNLIPDAYLAALAIEAKAEWITTDRDYKAFEPALKWRLLKP